METVFRRIPGLFVELYRPQFEIWAREFRARGKKCAIVFERLPGAPAVLDEAGRPVQAGAWLEAEIDGSNPAAPRMVVKPASEHDAELIARHCSEMTGHVLQ